MINKGNTGTQKEVGAVKYINKYIFLLKISI